MSQDLYDLPAGWEWKSILDVAKIGVAKGFIPSINENSQVAFIGMSDIDEYTGLNSSHVMRDYSEVKTGYTKFQKNSVLVAKITPCTENNKTALINSVDGFATTEVFPVHPSSMLSPKYLLYFFRSQSIREVLISKMEGATGRQRVPLKVMQNISIPLPPLAEQTRIVEKLDAVLSRIDTAIDELQQSLALVDAFYKSSLKVKTNDVEEKWNRYSLNELGYFSGGGTPSKSRSDYWDGEILWITPKDMKSWKLSDSEMKITEIGLKESSAKLLPKNSVLIVARSGILQHTLPVAINTVEATVNQDIKVFIPNDKIMPEYVQYMLKGHEAFILSQLVKGGVTVESLKYSEFQEYPFPVPDLKAQIQIVGELNALNDKITQLKTEITAKIDLFNQLKASVLDGAFRGEV